ESHADVIERPQLRHIVSVTFIWLLVVATCAFYPLAPFVNAIIAKLGTPADLVYNALIYSVSLHVALSLIFYLDPAMFALMWQNRIRFLIVTPAAFLASFWLWVFCDKTVEVWFMLGFIVWTYWHFQKQHWGVYSFIRLHEGSRPAKWDRAVVLWGGYL